MPEEEKNYFIDSTLSESVRAVKQQVDYYFSDYNYEKDEHLRSKCDADGWIEISEILFWYRMVKLNATYGEIKEAANKSTVFEIS